MCTPPPLKLLFFYVPRQGFGVSPFAIGMEGAGEEKNAFNFYLAGGGVSPPHLRSYSLGQAEH